MLHPPPRALARRMVEMRELGLLALGLQGDALSVHDVEVVGQTFLVTLVGENGGVASGNDSRNIRKLDRPQPRYALVIFEMKEGRDQKRRNNQHCYQNPLHSP